MEVDAVTKNQQYFIVTGQPVALAGGFGFIKFQVSFHSINFPQNAVSVLY